MTTPTTKSKIDPAARYWCDVHGEIETAAAACEDLRRDLDSALPPLPLPPAEETRP